MYFPQLQELSDTSSIYAHVMQHALADRLQDVLGPRYSFDVDLRDGRASFTGEPRPDASGRHATATLHFGTEIIASIAPGPRSLLWGWARDNTGLVPPTLALQMRAHGEQHGITMLTQPEVPFTVDPGEDDEQWCKGAAHDIGRAYVAITGRAPYFATNPGNGSQLVLALHGADLPTPRLDVTMPRVTMEAIEVADVRDHRRALHCFATKCGWGLQWAPDLSSLVIVDDVIGNSATLTFDELGRNTGMRLTLTNT